MVKKKNQREINIPWKKRQGKKLKNKKKVCLAPITCTVAPETCAVSSESPKRPF